MTKDLREERRPADLWFWDDWIASVDVRTCSLAARGLWMDMLSIMNRASAKGCLTINGEGVDNKTLATWVGAPEAEVKSLVEELERKHVFSRLEDGTIYNRRMQREGELSRKRAAAGLKGASSRWQKDGNTDAIGIAQLEDEDDNDNEYGKEKMAVYGWNVFAGKHGLPTVRDVARNSKREHALHGRLADKTFDLAEILAQAETQPFLYDGNNDRKWKMDFDWLLVPGNYIKVLEGKYRKETDDDHWDKWAKKMEEKG